MIREDGSYYPSANWILATRPTRGCHVAMGWGFDRDGVQAWVIRIAGPQGTYWATCDKSDKDAEAELVATLPEDYKVALESYHQQAREYFDSLSKVEPPPKAERYIGHIPEED